MRQFSERVRCPGGARALSGRHVNRAAGARAVAWEETADHGANETIGVYFGGDD